MGLFGKSKQQKIDDKFKNVTKKQFVRHAVAKRISNYDDERTNGIRRDIVLFLDGKSNDKAIQVGDLRNIIYKDLKAYVNSVGTPQRLKQMRSEIFKVIFNDFYEEYDRIQCKDWIK